MSKKAEVVVRWKLFNEIEAGPYRATYFVFYLFCSRCKLVVDLIQRESSNTWDIKVYVSKKLKTSWPVLKIAIIL